MAFDTQIQALAGTATQSEMDQWMADGAKEIINLLPLKLKERCASISIVNATNGTTLDMDTGEILSITRLSADSSGYYTPCREIPAVYGDLSNDSTNLMYYATVTDPVYWVTSNSSGASTLFIKPTTTDAQPANVYRVQYPSIDASAVSAIANFPNEAEYLVVLYAAIKVLQNKMNEKSSDLPSFVLPTVPTAVATPSFTYTDASVSDMIAPIMTLVDKAALTASAPVYTKPTITTVPTWPTFSSMVLPPVPALPTMRDNTLDISSLTAPTYKPQAVAPDFADADKWINVEEDNEMLSSRISVINAQQSDFNNRMTNEMNDFNNEKDIWEKNVEQEIKNLDLKRDFDIQAIDKYKAQVNTYQQEVNKEVQRWTNEEFNTKIQEYSVKYQNFLSQYGQDMQNELNGFNKENVVYQEDIARKTENFNKDIQIALQNVTAELDKNKTNLNKDTQVALQNAIQNFQQDVTEYDAKVKEYQANLQKYQAEVSAQAQAVAASLQTEQTDYQWLQSQHAQLKQDYNQGIQILIGGEGPPQEQEQGE